MYIILTWPKTSLKRVAATIVAITVVIIIITISDALTAPPFSELY